MVRVPWAEPDSRFTRLLERLAIDLLLECDVSGAAGILGLSWDEAWGIQERAVKRGHARKGERVVTQIGVDEKAAAKGHRYLTLVCDLEQGTVEHIADDRKQAWTAISRACPRRSARASRPWRWTCGTRTSSPRWTMAPRPLRRSSSTGFTSWAIWARPSIPSASRSTEPGGQGGRDADGHQASVVVCRREPLGQASGSLRHPQGHEPQGGACPGDQGESA